ncbi:endonuclease domain-containing 1 protein-like [Acipenser ruthenus]|uniref:endonuclease domain-containing 1 protein-like n=1 Tax=Acipenser ruthenus TaxID=7906 RepID=UPI002741E652|nr:endonuclease domain-containing 1 protein-like [Acipenser ruthenus]
MQCFIIACLALAAVEMGSGEVRDDFNSCSQFFYKRTPPSGFERIALAVPEDANTHENPETCQSAYRQNAAAYICQKEINLPDHSFATLYDRGRRIPLYSAYILDPRPKQTSGRPQNYFNVEPQLVHRDLAAEQTRELDTRTLIREYNNEHRCLESYPEYQRQNKIQKSQAVDKDFSGYDRGHLNPSGHHLSSAATFTFTNVAPMSKTMNNGNWNQLEQKMVQNASSCSEMYVVTGVVPGQTWTGLKDKKGEMVRRVNVPSHIWNAFCCLNNNKKPALSRGFLASNTDTGTVQEMSVTDLERELVLLLGLNNGRVQIFDSCNPPHQRSRSWSFNERQQKMKQRSRSRSFNERQQKMKQRSRSRSVNERQQKTKQRL